MNANRKKFLQLAEALSHYVTEFLQKALSEKWGIVTCHHISLSRDARIAEVWISFYPPLDDKADVAGIIKPHQRDLFTYLKKNMPNRFIPQLIYKYDKSIASQQHVNELIDQL